MDSKKVETIARRLCEIRKIDPDKVVISDDGHGNSCLTWQNISIEVIAHLQMQEAVRREEWGDYP